MNGLKVDDFLYIIDLKGISTFFNTLEIKPVFWMMKTFDQKQLGFDDSEVEKHKDMATFLVLKRNFDLMTPLLTDWHYQSAIHQHLPYKNSVVKIGKKDFLMKDDFFVANKFNDLEKVGDNLKSLLKELERKKINISNYQFDDIEGATNYSKVIETHLSIHNKVMDECLRLEEISESEIKILKGEEFSFKEHSHSKKNLLKLKLISFLKNPTKNEILGKDLHQKFIELHNPINFSYKFNFNEKPSNLGYETPLKRIVRHLIKKKLNSNAFSKIGSEDSNSNIYIIYVKGGITYREYRDAMIQAAEMNVQLYLLSDKIINQEYILENLKEFL